MTMQSALSGSLAIYPGCVPAISGQRPMLAERILSGKPAGFALRLLPQLYALCGEAHRVCATLAVNAALGLSDSASGEHAERLADETAREHIRRIWLDWPIRLSSSSAVMAAGFGLSELARCALLKPAGTRDEAAGHWVEECMLGTTVGNWLAGWQDDPGGWLDAWSRRSDVWPARLLARCREHAQLTGAARPLAVHADPVALRELAREIEASASFASEPVWNHVACETGCWTRLGTNVRGIVFDTAWLRLGARIAELAGLMVMPRDPARSAEALQCGALRIEPGQALGWCEMARGLLLHWVRVRETQHGPVIDGYRIVAPTEWNFHPRGALARTLEGLGPVEGAVDRQRIGALVAAYDPCVAYTVEYAHDVRQVCDA
ncbi:hypothetical protein LMG22037_06242 [Paraburkholderia phenoliruptrix]|uniref:Uncharacterized protein n=1 Tax=Paraburkholderia phenoliruptrix TaxID=252970 RepID=A0A6J5CKW2_9BURK|nr:nickel-dependent hydrogenase large subunit [Paraburkholderia phenoliruptrix]CAB3738553.1 hypothetical protein LMG22037_06242 [Paraburkholderia phenoliruptrix]